ncbi:MAG: 50S ribosomal protein L10 [Aminobacterium sp.]|jgi:large subunit ribosomal protein L10|nr:MULTISPECIES: 50S ribosomal protein L10 [unclassified Aminobacterium]MDD2207707.1 50S ribosomal protein L10 [Aminobacterium sp.]MDD3427093.1 50S ribosomal protein L10 [Aminobacterium sp.]MDD3708569.1 50S ribosomal protein L10 [Aminobacterium sp.]MDD4229747.1 50S ribosomal protein L10 [Aminobacterium sp.]MDD4552539.1 50S ribosomal protein L10 [Aminobacterium sp.]
MPANVKFEQVDELKEMLSKSEAVFIAEYRGLTVAQFTDLRSRVRQAGGEMKVAKNTLFKIALREENKPIPEDIMTGPNVYTLAYEDPVAVAKVFKEFSKDKANKAFITKGGVLGENVLNAAQVDALADLPSREVLIAQVVSTIAAPLSGLVTVLSGPIRGLATCLSQIKEKKEQAA